MSTLTMFDTLFSTPQGEKHYYEAGILVEVCEKLHELMEEQGFKNKDIANKLGVSDSQVSQWLAGKASMQLKTVANILYAMGLKFENFKAKKIVRHENLTANDMKYTCTWFEQEANEATPGMITRSNDTGDLRMVA